MKKTVSFISDSKLINLIDCVAKAEHVNRSLLLRSIFFKFAHEHHPNLVETFYE